uniref:Uncharacterized protein n=1 Tax=Glossina austeni TaxID=7395 RepID=A0A1A9UZL8_GLOAU
MLTLITYIYINIDVCVCVCVWINRDVCTKTTLASCGINEKPNGGQLYRVETASGCGFYRNVIDYHHCTFPSGITKQHLKLVNRNAVEERIYTIERHEVSFGLVVGTSGIHPVDPSLRFLGNQCQTKLNQADMTVAK